MNRERSDTIRQAIELLVSDTNVEYAHQRPIALFAFYAWTLFPRSSRKQQAARLLASVKLLRRLEKKFANKISEKNSASALRKFLSKNAFQSLYDQEIGPPGGWTRLATTMTYAEFDDEAEKRLADLHIVADLLDFRFKYLNHGGIKRNGNIIHGHVFRWWQGRTPSDLPSMPGISRDSIQKRWKNNKMSAIFVYTAQRLGPQFGINPLADNRFTATLIAEANNTEKLKRYFGKCRYVAHTLNDRDVTRCFPSEEVLPCVHPETLPIEPKTLVEFLRAYPDLYNEYQTGPAGL
jgi:hypothetical protein